ncbi:p33 [Venturia canescens]|uniref:P33 n=1 Tax=Venturia canescens TaxID=32260 RepID=A0ACB9ZI94_9HYME|nr:uncharacterized LOC122408205 [Venturia canescens]KAI5630601.1 p33 [Venturia canescens]
MNASELVSKSSSELTTLSIGFIIERFTPIYNEFRGYLEGIRIKQSYKNLIDGFLHFLSVTYDLNKETMLVNVGNYSTSEWGPLYWSFLHLSSILLQHALAEKMVNDVRGFPAIIYNIDEILPCSMCQQHYYNIKDSSEIRQIIKTIAFGHVVQGTFYFHGMITENMNKSDRFETKPAFLTTQFCELYHCFPTSMQDTRSLSTIARSPIDWQSTLHVHLSVILGIASQVSFLRASNRLKRLYGFEPTIANPRVINPQEYAFEKSSDEMILSILNKCLENDEYPRDDELSDTNRVLITRARKVLREQTSANII